MWNHDPFGGPCMCNLFLLVLSGLEVRLPRISIAVGSVFLPRLLLAMLTTSLSSMSFDRHTAIGQQKSELRLRSTKGKFCASDTRNLTRTALELQSILARCKSSSLVSTSLLGTR